MATNNNADEYANGRLNIFFEGFPNSLTGQCVSLVKWFLQEMTSVPNPQAARGNAKDYGNSLVSQGHAVEVSANERRRGDVVVWKSDGGGYGHIGILLSGDRIFEQNVGIAGSRKGSYGGNTVYASRVDPLYTNWRKGAPTFYRIKTYSEGNDDMIKPEDLSSVRVVMSEVEGWDMNSIHSGKDDGLIMGAWQGKSWTEFIMHGWSVQNTHRGHLVDQINSLNATIADLNTRPTKTQVEQLKAAALAAQAEADAAKKVAADSKAATDKLLAEKAADTETGNALLRWLGSLFNSKK